MKPLYFLSLSLLMLTSCSKDIFKRYDKRILGTWDLTDVDRAGVGGDTENLIFRNGTFVFGDDDVLSYTDPNGDTYHGNWDINRHYSGNQSEDIRTLSVNAVNFGTQEIRSELFENIRFTGTNKFKAFIYSRTHTFIFHFKQR